MPQSKLVTVAVNVPFFGSGYSIIYNTYIYDTLYTKIYDTFFSFY